jgi:hypothetical protein
VTPTLERVTGLRVAIEAGDKKVFASALEWPGWSRAAKTEDAAVETLLAYAPRYAAVAQEAGTDLPDAFDVEIEERQGGGGGTDFGVPSSLTLAFDARPVDRAEAERLARLVEAAWTVLDRTAAGAPAELRKGPRGGGRDRDRMVAHVIEADGAYARELGLRLGGVDGGDHDAIAAYRRAMLAVLRAPSDGGPLAGRRWPHRYAARRIAWHALDHAWEMQDRSAPG